MWEHQSAGNGECGKDCNRLQAQERSRQASQHVSIRHIECRGMGWGGGGEGVGHPRVSQGCS